MTSALRSFVLSGFQSSIIWLLGYTRDVGEYDLWAVTLNLALICCSKNTFNILKSNKIHPFNIRIYIQFIAILKMSDQAHKFHLCAASVFIVTEWQISSQILYQDNFHIWAQVKSKPILCSTFHQSPLKDCATGDKVIQQWFKSPNLDCDSCLINIETALEFVMWSFTTSHPIVPTSPHPVQPTAVSQELGKSIIVMEMLADVVLGHFVHLASWTGPIQSNLGAFCVSSFPYSKRENSTSASVGVSPAPSERAPDSQLCISHSVKHDLSNPPRWCCPNRILAVKHPLSQKPSPL